MVKYFMSDIHGYYYEMRALLKHVNFNPEKDSIVFGGDMIDRGPDSARVVKYIKEIQLQHPKKVKVLIGNHEEMMLWYLTGVTSMWLQHGGIEAAKSFNEVFGVASPEVDKYMEWFMGLPLAIEDEDGVYCHAGIDIAYSLDEQPREVLWTTYSELFSCDKDEILEYTNEKRLFRGHDPVRNIITDGARVCCDLGMGVLSKENAGLALVDITNNKYYRFHAESKTITENKIMII